MNLFDLILVREYIPHLWEDLASDSILVYLVTQMQEILYRFKTDNRR